MIYSIKWFDLIYFGLQSPQLVEHSCSARMKSYYYYMNFIGLPVHYL